LGVVAAERLVKVLETLWLIVSARSGYARLLSDAQHLGLHRATVPPAIYKASRRLLHGPPL
jgi:hypothetical protein